MIPLPYIIEETMTVTQSVNHPGREFINIEDRATQAEDGIYRGNLIYRGTAEKPVVFTTQEDDLYGNPKICSKMAVGLQ